MKKLLLASTMFLAPSLAAAQCTGVFPANTLCGNLTGSPAPPSAFSAGGSVVGPGTTVVNNFALWNNTTGTLLKDSGWTTGTSGHAIPFLDGTNTWANPQTITGLLTANGGVASTTLSASSTVSGTGFSTYLASPPAIGGSAAAAGSFTTLTTSGIAYVNGNAYFGSGVPWIDVKSGANSCAAAVGDGVTDDTAAIQCQINAANANGGEAVFLPCATYFVGSGLTMKGAVGIFSPSRECAQLTVLTNDVAVLTFDATSVQAWAAHLIVTGRQVSGGGSHGAIEIASGVKVGLRDMDIGGGADGLRDAGGDGYREDLFISCANGGNAMVNSTGANWWVRIKLDLGGTNTATYGFAQTTTVTENFIDGIDISAGGGTFTNASLLVSQAGSDFFVNHGVFSSPVVISTASHVMIEGSKFGSTVSIAAGNLGIVGSTASALTVTGAGIRSCAANFGITC